VVSSFGTRVGTDGTMPRALGPAEGRIALRNASKGYIVWGCRELKRKFRFI
jgi:hypothetical protein